MSILEKIKQKTTKIKHKEVVLFVVIIVLIIFVFILMKNPTKTTTVSAYKDMSAKEELSCRITEAVNAISGDSESKIIIYWDSSSSQNQNTTLGSLFETSASDKDEGIKILGIAVVCNNGDNAETKVKISFMLSKVFDIDADRISVYGKK